MRRHLPGFQQIANLGIATKLGLIVIFLALPVCALLLVQFQDRQAATSQSSSEANGLDYVTAIVPFMREVQLHRGLAERVLRGDATARANMERTAASADQALLAINAQDRKWGDDFKTRDLVAFLNTEWPKARDGNASTTESAALHTSVIENGVFPLISTVAAESKLMLDPDLESRTLIIALTTTLPRLTESLSQMRGTGAGALTARKGLEATAETRQSLSGQMALATYHSSELTRQLEAAMADNPRFESDLRTMVERSQASRGVFFDNTRDQVVEASVLSPTGAEGYFLLGGSAIDLSNELLVSASEALKADFEARADSARSDFAISFSAAGIGVMLALSLALFISATITRPMKHLAEVADRMSLGELDVEIDVEGDNEIGQLAESLRRMQASLRSAIERLRQRRAA